MILSYLVFSAQIETREPRNTKAGGTFYLISGEYNPRMLSRRDHRQLLQQLHHAQHQLQERVRRHGR